MYCIRLILGFYITKKYNIIFIFANEINVAFT